MAKIDQIEERITYFRGKLAEWEKRKAEYLKGREVVHAAERICISGASVVVAYCPKCGKEMYDKRCNDCGEKYVLLVDLPAQRQEEIPGEIDRLRRLRNEWLMPHKIEEYEFGIPNRVAKALMVYGDWESVGALSDDEILAIPGVGPRVLEQIRWEVKYHSESLEKHRKIAVASTDELNRLVAENGSESHGAQRELSFRKHGISDGTLPDADNPGGA